MLPGWPAALVVPALAARVLALVAAACLVAGTYVLPAPNSGVDFGLLGALIVLLVVAAAASPRQPGGRRLALVAMAAAVLLLPASIALGFGHAYPLSWYYVNAQSTYVAGFATAVLVPMVYWSGRQLLLARTGWLAALPATAGSLTWLTLIVGPASDVASEATIVGAIILTMLGVRVALSRTRGPLQPSRSRWICLPTRPSRRCP